MNERAVAEAPGRVNLIGEHTDYNGGSVLPAATTWRTRVSVSLRGDSRVLGTSAAAGPAEALRDDPPRGSWLDYVRGVALELEREGRFPRTGFRVEVTGNVPSGAGLSSSAALEVASALALAAAAGRPFAPRERGRVAELCRAAEAEFVGVPCGIMDQWAALFGRRGAALRLRCSDLRWSLVPLPVSLELLVVDTGVRHALREGGFAERQAQCLAALAGARRALGRPLASLSELAPGELAAIEEVLEPLLLRRARHVVTENARVDRFVSALGAGDEAAAGALLFASHESLRRDYEVTCAESDWLVRATRHLGGAYGARMTGAGWGGCTLHLVRAGEGEAVATALADGFEARFARRPRHWITAPGDGAALLSAA